MKHPGIYCARIANSKRLHTLRAYTPKRPARTRFIQEKKLILLGLTTSQIFGLSIIGVAVFVGFLRIG